MVQISNPEHVFCAECLYKMNSADESPCNKCVMEPSGKECTEWVPAGTPEVR